MKTKQIMIAVAIDADGNWACHPSPRPPATDKEALAEARAALLDCDYESDLIADVLVSATVERPEVQRIQGAAERR